MDPQQREQLNAFIRQQKQRGEADEAIRVTLRQYNWTDEAITQVLAEANAPVSAAPAVSSQPAQEPATEPQPVQQVASEHSAESAPSEASAPATEPEPAKVVASGKYGVFTAIQDFFNAVQRNAAIFFGVVGVGYGAGAALLIVLSFVFAAYILGGQIGSGGRAELVPVVIVWFIVTYVLTVVVSAFSVAVASVALMDATRNSPRSIGQVLRIGVEKLPRMVISMVVFWLALFWPLIAGALIGLLAAVAGIDGVSVTLILFLIGAFAVVWILIALLRFPLIPFIALFEPEVPYAQLPRRSHQLMKPGGIWFVFKAALLYAAVSVVLSVVVELLTAASPTVSGVLSTIVMVALSVVATGVLVMLYRRQRAIVG